MQKSSGKLKHTLILSFIILFIGISNVGAQSCLQGNHFFRSQGELNQFKADNPNCTRIEGNVVIESFVTNLSPFSNIKSVGGNLQIRNCNELVELKGLENLEAIGGELFLFKNEKIENFKALKSLRKIGGLKVDINPSFRNFEGLEKITSLTGKLFINENRRLQNCIGLDNLQIVEGSVNIRYNNNMINLIGLDNLKEVGSLEVSHNDAMENLDGLNQLKTSNGSVSINYNNKLSNACGLNSLELVSVTFSIIENKRLKNVDGLFNLKKIGKFLRLESNEQLNSIKGFKNVNHFPLWKLIIIDNPALTICNNTMVCNVIEDRINHEIVNNGPNCNSADEIYKDCNTEVIPPDPEVQYINNRTITGTKTFNSNFEIESNSFIFFSSKVVFKAVNAITLTNGFDVKKSANFSAEIVDEVIEEIVTEPIENSCN